MIFIEISYGKAENRKKIRKYKITIDRLDGEGIIQDVERYGVIMFVSFSVGNTGPFKEITGITTLAENLKKSS